MKKKYNDLTIKEIESILEDTLMLCRLDENLEWPCKKGCKFHFDVGGIGYCLKHGFLSMLYDTIKENQNENLKLDDSGDEIMIEIPDNIIGGEKL